jgi:hypothetical protein
MTIDRADAATRTLLQIVASDIRDDSADSLHRKIATQLREEFAEVARITLHEIRPEDG